MHRKIKGQSDGGKIRTTGEVLTLLYCVWVDRLMIKKDKEQISRTELMKEKEVDKTHTLSTLLMMH